MLLTKRQEVIYDIFNWTANSQARVNVIAISNTLDLPERMLNPRISSRLVNLKYSSIIYYLEGIEPYQFSTIRMARNCRDY